MKPIWSLLKGSGVDPQDLRPLNKLKLVAGSTLALTGKYSNFMCLRTFSKAYGLAGLRVGYAVGSAGIMRVLGKTLLPYHVNAWSLAVAEEVYRQKDLYKEQLETIIEQRDLIREQLEQMGLKIWPSATNFLTCCPQGELTARLAAACEQQYGSQGEKHSRCWQECTYTANCWRRKFWCAIIPVILYCRDACGSR